MSVPIHDKEIQNLESAANQIRMISLGIMITSCAKDIPGLCKAAVEKIDAITETLAYRDEIEAQYRDE